MYYYEIKEQIEYLFIQFYIIPNLFYYYQIENRRNRRKIKNWIKRSTTSKIAFEKPVIRRSAFARCCHLRGASRRRRSQQINYVNLLAPSNNLNSVEHATSFGVHGSAVHINPCHRGDGSCLRIIKGGEWVERVVLHFANEIP